MTEGRILEVLGDILTAAEDMDGRVDEVEAVSTANRLATGQEIIPRSDAVSSVVTTATQSLRLVYFTSRKAETSTQVRIFSGSTAAGATPSLVRIGLYLIDEAGDATLVASTANDTTLLGSTFTGYTKAWSSSYAMVMGQRYALGLLVVTAVAAPTLLGNVPFPGSAATVAELLLSPPMTGLINSQADLPASFLGASVAASGSRFYAAVLPA